MTRQSIDEQNETIVNLFKNFLLYINPNMIDPPKKSYLYSFLSYNFTKNQKRIKVFSTLHIQTNMI